MIAAGKIGESGELGKTGLTVKDLVGGAIKAAGAGIGAAMTADQAQAEINAKHAGPNRGGAQKQMYQTLGAQLGGQTSRPPILSRPLPQYTAPTAGTMNMPYNVGGAALPKRPIY